MSRLTVAGCCLILGLVGCGDPMGGLDGALPDGALPDGAAFDGGGGLDGGQGRGDAGAGDDGGGDAFDGAAAADGSTVADGSTSLDAGGDGPDAGFACTTPGVIEDIPCGLCGTQTRFCTADGVWSYGSCSDEGICVPGTEETEGCELCGVRIRRCTSECVWIEGTCEEQGECEPGATVTATEGCPEGQARQLMCNSVCSYEPASACSSERCDPPGRIESVACGMCGSRQRFCNADGVWEYDACTGEGVCSPGATQPAACGNCGTLTQRCDETCRWVDGACSGEGECSPGDRERTLEGCPDGQIQTVECNDSCTYETVDACMEGALVDVLFLLDRTGSNWHEIRSQASTWRARCFDPLEALTGVAIGLAYYGDRSSSSLTFHGAEEIGATAADLQDDIVGRTELGGGDDSTMEALHIVAGGSPTTANLIPFTCSSGRVAGGCWRSDARRVLVMHTDEIARGGPDPESDQLYDPWASGPDWTTVRPALMSDGTSLLVLLDDGTSGTPDPLAQYQEMVVDLGQPSTDVAQETTVVRLGELCDDVVARVRGIAGL